MDGEKLQGQKLGSVKAVINSYGHPIFEDDNHGKKKFQTNYAEAENKLAAAKQTVKDLTQKIEASTSRTRSQIQDLDKLKMPKTRDDESISENSQFEKVMTELESVKQQLNKLKLDMAYITEQKRNADDETEKALTYSNSVEALTNEIDEINEEHVLVELARIEAVREYREIEDQQRENAEKYREKKQIMIQEIEDAKDLETKLAITLSDISMLESKLKQAEKTEDGLEKTESLRYDDVINRELEATKKELSSVKLEIFELMSSMDIVRNEFMHVMDKTTRFKEKEEKANISIQNLNSELHRAEAMLEETSAAADEAKSIRSNPSQTLEQIKSEIEAGKNERSLINEEIAYSKAEVQRIETEINSAEERLEAAMRDLEEIKSSEVIALENLKAIIENTMRNRNRASNSDQTITISKFEYEYLKGRADGAIEIADKKVEAARAWIQALKASEKEILIKINLSRRETREINTEESMKQKMIPENLQIENGLPSKGMNKSAKMTPARRAKFEHLHLSLSGGEKGDAKFRRREMK
ncbi:hypothetical protein DH2020_037775 [Rehmannia glutinosa]|uniref:Uncharacterized protein n=1 Tax=Rehmannia glutinosa TaxID=99300 RepID=A0ABR0V2G3_REHGL